MANFGFSVGDIVTVGSLAWNVYKACSNASSEFREVAREVISLHAAVKELEEEASNPDSIIQRAIENKQKELQTLVQNIGQVLAQLEGLVLNYNSLGTTNRRKRDIIRFSAEGLEYVRSKVILHTSAVNLFLGSLSAASLGRVERKLDEIVKELRNGQRDTSAIAVSDDEDDPVAKQQWKALRKELVEDGFRKEDIDDHKTWIKAEMRKRINVGGKLKGQNDMETDSRNTISGTERQPCSKEGFTERYNCEGDTDMNEASNQDMDVGSSSALANSPLDPFSRWRTSDSPPQAISQDVQPGELEVSKEVSNFPEPSTTDPTPRNIYDSRAVSGAESVDEYGFPLSRRSPSVDEYNFPTLRRSPSISSITSVHSEISEHDSYGNLVKRTVTTTTTTHYSTSATDDSTTSDRDHRNSVNCVSSRTLLRPQQLPAAIGPPPPQSMMGQFASKMSSNTQKKHKCKVCDKRFTRPSSLQTHMYSHTGEKPFRCGIEGCGRMFSVVSNLRRHRKVHDGEAKNSDADSESEL